MLAAALAAPQTTLAIYFSSANETATLAAAAMTAMTRGTVTVVRAVTAMAFIQHTVLIGGRLE